MKQKGSAYDIIVPAYEPDKRLIQVVQDTIKPLKPVLLSLMMGVAQAITTITTKQLFIGATVPIPSTEREQLKTAFSFKKK